MSRYFLFFICLFAITHPVWSQKFILPGYHIKAGEQGKKYRVKLSPQSFRGQFYIKVTPEPGHKIEYEMLKSNWSFALHNTIPNGYPVNAEFFTDSIYHFKVMLDGEDYKFDLIKMPDEPQSKQPEPKPSKPKAPK